jgi:hypothetical protein
MHGITRGTTTLLAAGAAGLLIWFATQIDEKSVGGFWAVYGLIAGAGLVMALAQLLGGWTKWGWPRLAVGFLLTAFIPIAVVSLWIVLAAEPGNGWFHRHVLSWSSDIHVRGLVNSLTEFVSVFAFGIGLVFGFSFDTTGPRVRDRDVVAAETDGQAADEPLTADRYATAPQHDREVVTTSRSDGPDRS